MGGQKAVSINQFPILAWYQQEFRNYLLRPAALMVIGYSFSDAHSIMPSCMPSKAVT
jgi:hypothetical protein